MKKKKENKKRKRKSWKLNKDNKPNQTLSFLRFKYQCLNPVSIFMFKLDDGNIRTMFEMFKINNKDTKITS